MLVWKKVIKRAVMHEAILFTAACDLNTDVSSVVMKCRDRSRNSEKDFQREMA